MRTFIVITTAFSAVHCWKDCPIEGLEFLKNPHRHVFHVVVKFKVTHADRQIEFLDKKKIVNSYLSTNFDNRDLGQMSCEMIAQEIFENFQAAFVSVYEDNENGAEVYED